MHNDSPIPFQGIYGGNKAGPTISVALSAPLIEIMQGAGHDIKFYARLSQEKYSLVVLAFVDDTGMVEGYLIRTEINIEEVYISMQKTINRWERGLKSIRGAIRPDKSFIHPIYLKWYHQGD